MTLGNNHLHAVVADFVEERRQVGHGHDMRRADPITISISGPTSVDEGDATTSTIRCRCHRRESNPRPI